MPADRKAVPLGTVPDEVTPPPLFFVQRSQSAFSLSREDAPRTPSLEAASRQPRGQQPMEEEALPSWKSVDRLDQTSNCPVGFRNAVGRLLSPSYHQSEWGCAHLGQLGHQVTGSLTQHTVYKAGMLPMWAVCLLRPARQWAGGFRSLGCTAPLQLPVVCGQEQVSY